MSKFLNIPPYIWIAQVSYVIVALGILFLLLKFSGISQKIGITSFVIGYVIIMIIINITWRLIVAKIWPY